MTTTRGSTLSPDWKPSAEEIDYGLNLGFAREQVLEMSEDMRLWALANKNRDVARKADWHLTFLGWMRRQAQRTGRNKPHEKGYAELAEELRNDPGPDTSTASDPATSIAESRRRRCY